MRIAVPLETAAGEHRVALTPDSAGRLVKGGHEVRIQAGAGTRAGFPDSAYEAVGASVVDAASLYADAALVCRVQPPTPAEVAKLPNGCTLLALLAPSRNGPLLATLAARNGPWAEADVVLSRRAT